MHNSSPVRPPLVARRAATIALAAVCAVACAAGIAGCSSSSTHTSAGTGAAPASSSAAATPTPSTALAKAAFISQANAICTKVDTQLSAMTKPSSDQDYAGLAAGLEESLALFKSYISQVQPLADQTADAAELNSKWLTLEQQDVARAEPLITQMIAALKAKDAAQIKAIGGKLDALPDHSTQYEAEMTSYGLTACVQMERDSNGG